MLIGINISITWSNKNLELTNQKPKSRKCELHMKKNKPTPTFLAGLKRSIMAKPVISVMIHCWFTPLRCGLNPLATVLLDMDQLTEWTVMDTAGWP